MSPTTLAMIAGIVWLVLVGLACGLSALLVIGRAFGSSASKGLPDLILAPGLKVGEGNLAIVLLVSWLCWAVIGGVVILVGWMLLRK